MENIEQMEALFQAAERAREALAAYDKLATQLVAQMQDKALAHQCIVQSSSLFKHSVKDVDVTTKYALDNVTGTSIVEAREVCGFKVGGVQYKTVQAKGVEILDKSNRSWAHILKACSEVNAKAVQQRLSASAFTDKKTGKPLLNACLGLVGITHTDTFSITKVE